MTADIYDIFYYCSLLISVIAGVFLYKKSEAPYKWLTWLLVLTLISELIAKYIAFGLGRPNSMVYHIFTPLEFTLYVTIFILFLKQESWHNLLWASAGGLILFEIINTILFQSLSEANTNTMILEGILLVLLSLLLFLKIRETPSTISLTKMGNFWFASAVLCYYAFNILIWGFHNMKVYLLDNPPQIIYDLNMILSGLLYLTFLIAMSMNVRFRSKTQ